MKNFTLHRSNGSFIVCSNDEVIGSIWREERLMFPVNRVEWRAQALGNNSRLPRVFLSRDAAANALTIATVFAYES